MRIRIITSCDTLEEFEKLLATVSRTIKSIPEDATHWEYRTDITSVIFESDDSNSKDMVNIRRNSRTCRKEM